MANPVDITFQENTPTILYLEKHAEFIKDYGKKENTFEYGITDYLRVSGMYWGLTALELMNTLPTQSKNEVCNFITIQIYYLLLQLFSDSYLYKKLPRSR